MDLPLFAVSLGLYVVSAVLYLAYAFTKRESLSRAGWSVLLLGAGIHVASVVLRMVIGRELTQSAWYVPWSNWFESFSIFALILALEYLVLQWREHWPILGAFVVPLIGVIMGAAFLSPDGAGISPVSSELKSVWMYLHVPVVMVSYGALALAFVVGHAYLIQEAQIKSKKPSSLSYRLPSLDDLEHLIYTIILRAWPVLFLGIVLGIAYAIDTDADANRWDSKIIWAISTWFIYSVYLVLRRFVGWRGRRTTYLSMLGFFVAIVTFVGTIYFS